LKKKIFISFFIFNSSFLIFHSSAQPVSWNINLLSQFDDTAVKAEPNFGIRYNNVWGWADTVKHREYAILSTVRGSFFIDVTVPTSPVVCDFVKGRRDSCIFRDCKTYLNYAYLVSDDIAPNSFQIVDMSYLPDSVHVVYDSDTLIVRAHNITIEGNKMFCGNVHYDKNNFGNYYSMAVYSLANPVAPQFISALNDPNVNIMDDMQVRHDTIFGNCALDGFYIYKMNSNNTFSEIASISPFALQGYNHSTALTADSRTIILCDWSSPFFPVTPIDVSDMNNVQTLPTFQDTNTTTFSPHGAFIRKGENNFVTVAYYQDGLQIFNISNPSAAYRTGFYDTYPKKNDGNSVNCVCNYTGCGSAFVNFPSGTILACDFQHGMFVLDGSAALMLGENEIEEGKNSLQVFPNPTEGKTNLSMNRFENLSIRIYTVYGECIHRQIASSPNCQIDLSSEPNGIYFLKATDLKKKISYSAKIVKR
jgi:choice-of-anchor B domain-containing protein